MLPRILGLAAALAALVAEEEEGTPRDEHAIVRDVDQVNEGFEVHVACLHRRTLGTAGERSRTGGIAGDGRSRVC